MAVPHINMYQSQVYMCSPQPHPELPSLLSLPCSSGLSQSTGFGCPASCIKPALVICFTNGNVHVSMLFSQIIPSLSSPTESKSLFFTCLLCCPAGRIVFTVFLNSTYAVNIQYLSFSFWLTSLCTIGSRFSHLIRTDSNAFNFVAK